MPRYRINGIRNYNVNGFHFINGILNIPDSDPKLLAKWKKTYMGLRPHRKIAIREIIERSVEGSILEPLTPAPEDFENESTIQVEDSGEMQPEFPQGSRVERGAGLVDPVIEAALKSPGDPGSTKNPQVAAPIALKTKPVAIPGKIQINL